jgi:hypothetical protein
LRFSSEARKLGIDAHGNLVLDLHDGQVQFLKPHIYQEASEGRNEIAGKYTLKRARVVGFHVWPDAATLVAMSITE